MLIGLLSDTHIPDAVMTLPPQLKEVFCDVDLILHAGDIFSVSVLDELERIAPVLAARGDSDYFETKHDPRVKERHILNLEGVSIWLCHDGQWQQGNAGEPLPAVIVCGHTHWPAIKNRDSRLWINPGSPTYPSYQCQLGTVALLTIAAGKAEAQIVQLR